MPATELQLYSVFFLQKPLNEDDSTREFSSKHNIPIYYWNNKDGWELNQGQEHNGFLLLVYQNYHYFIISVADFDCCPMAGHLVHMTLQLLHPLAT